MMKIPRLSRSTWAGLASTSVWQIANYAIPLVTLPYLARVLGVSGFGILGIGAAVSAYAGLLTDWGFSFSATQAVAQARNDPVEVNRIIWATIAAKLVLGAVSTIATIVGSIFFVEDPQLRMVLVVSMLNVLGMVFSVDWALRGVEQFTKFAAGSIIGRIASVPLIFLLVHDASQVAEATFAGAAGGLISTAINLVMAARIGILRKPSVSGKEVLRQFRGGTHMFLSTAMISLYTNFLAIVLGITSGAEQVGLYSGGNKIRLAVHNLLAPISMVAYPRISYLASTDRERGHQASLRLLRVQGAIAFVLSAGLCITAPIAVHVLLGPNFEKTVIVLQILSWIIFVGSLSGALGTMVMLPFGLHREFTACISLGAILGLLLVIPLSYYEGATGTALGALLADFIVALSMYFVLVWRLDWFRLFGKAP
jgi:O-antigen/teichoic acid export membrane protein